MKCRAERIIFTFEKLDIYQSIRRLVMTVNATKGERFRLGDRGEFSSRRGMGFFEKLKKMMMA